MAPVPEAFPSDLPVFAMIRGAAGADAWARELPTVVAHLEETWSLTTAAPFRSGIAAWVAPAALADGSPGVLKVSWPHPEARGEGDALAVWDGAAAVRLLRADPSRAALLLERCRPGDPLAAWAGEVDDALELGARLLQRLWVVPEPGETRFPVLATVAQRWAELARARFERHRPEADPGVVRLGIDLLLKLPDGVAPVLLHGDFNPGNVLQAEREPWLAIDPKPMLGDPAYDPAPLLVQLDPPFRHADPVAVLGSRARRLADRLGLEAPRLLGWALAREVEGALWTIDAGQAATFSFARATVIARALERA